MTVPDDGGKTYFNNMLLEHLMTEFVSYEELDDIVVTVGTNLTNPMRALNLTRMTLMFGKYWP